MDYYLLTDLAARVGYHLALSGAETFRVEETIRRIIGAYGIECEAFSIPNCVMVSLEAANGKPLMVMKRVGFHGNDLESVEKLNALSRRICAETPDPSVAAQWLDETLKGRRHYSVPVYYLGNFCAAAGFCPVFGGTLRDSLLRTRFSAPSSRRSPWRCRRISPRASIWSTISTLSSSAP